jgi:hypothetical protein
MDGKRKMRCHPERSEGSASKRRKTVFVQAAAGEKIFRSHLGQSIEDDLHGNYEWFEIENSGASRRARPWFYVQVSDSSAGAFRVFSRCSRGNWS